ncbi:hypothetical protein ACK2M2_04515 [Acinetobacter sp. TY1]|uniref:hypothetical protein n=1 Tax=unclassified Acinetobacter TaxID=196816 RepID=UPI0039179A9E
MKRTLLSLVGILSGLLAVSTASADLTLVQKLQSEKSWGLIQPGMSCIEKYQFLPNGDILIQSNRERVTGVYHFMQAATNFELPAVMISFKTDNRQPDCAGSTIDQAGTSTTNFIKKVSDQQIYFCNDALGQSCPVYLRPER